MAAIYMWFEHEIQILTTTLYPIDAKDGVSFSVSLISGIMEGISDDAMDFSFSFLAGTLRVALKELELTEDQMDFSFAFSAGTLRQILKTVELTEDQIDVQFAFLAGTLDTVLVSIFTPDDALGFETSLVSESCSMTPA